MKHPIIIRTCLHLNTFFNFCEAREINKTISKNMHDSWSQFGLENLKEKSLIVLCFCMHFEFLNTWV